MEIMWYKSSVLCKALPNIFIKMQALVLVLILLSFKEAYFDKIETVLQWKILEFKYKSEQRKDDLKSGFYVPDVPVPLDIDVLYTGKSSKRVFMTIPRITVGTPITLGEYTGKNNSDGVPILKPYPSWKWHRNVSNCRNNQLVSVWGIKIDECGRLWVVDNGDYADTIFCPRKIVVFDLATNRVVTNVALPNKVQASNSILITSAVDIRNGKCEDATVYIADTVGTAIITYSNKTKIFSQALHRSMYPNPYYATINIGGLIFDAMDGVYGMDLAPHGQKERKLFYTALTSLSLNAVNTSVLQNQKAFISDPNAFVNEFKEIPSKRSKPCSAFAIDKNGISYFGLLTEPSTINCWNTNSIEYGKYIDTIYTNKTTMQFASGIKVINHPSGSQELWILTSRIHKAFFGSLDVNDVNFRISMGKIPQILMDTSCIKPNRKPRHNN